VRVIAGIWGSRQFETPKSVARPTTDRVRESLFAFLQARYEFADAKVLDLFAGSGALSWEMLSRGATFATLVDKSQEAVTILKRNAEVLGVRSSSSTSPVANILRANALEASLYPKLKKLVSNSTPQINSGGYNFVFLDPPYDLPDQQLELVFANLFKHNLLADDAVVVVESGKVRTLKSVEDSVPISRLKPEHRKKADSATISRLKPEDTATPDSVQVRNFISVENKILNSALSAHLSNSSTATISRLKPEHRKKADSVPISSQLPAPSAVRSACFAEALSERSVLDEKDKQSLAFSRGARADSEPISRLKPEHRKTYGNTVVQIYQLRTVGVDSA
jgi:16S rRNA (guanine966-N2)-methyltransferase